MSSKTLENGFFCILRVIFFHFARRATEAPKKAAKKKTTTKKKPAKEAVPEAMDVLKSVLEKAEVTDSKETEKIYDLLKKSTGKQQFYREMLKIYGLERGVEVYKTVRPEYTNLTKLVRK